VTNPDEPSDQELISKTLAGDRLAFSALMHRHSASLYRFVVRRLGDPEESYDVVQESFISAWTALKRYDPTRPFEAWLRRIAFNNCLDRRRKTMVRRALQQLARHKQDVDTVADEAPLADTRLMSDAARRKLEAALVDLPAHLREALVLTLWDGLSRQETADLLGINAKAVENRIYRAKLLLSQSLGPADLEDFKT
jgi:RNA polymerase sigma-70 factor (ECF subfamily)